MTLKKITICASTDNPEEVEAVKKWVEKWKEKCRVIRSYGCGCCVISYDVLAPSSAVKEVPENLLAWSNWAMPENQKRK